MGVTTFNEINFPDDGQDPFYELIESFFNQQDLMLFNNKLRSYMILAGGGTLVFNNETSSLEWTEDFAVKNCISGYLHKLRYGPDQLTRSLRIFDGQILYCVFQTSMRGENITHVLVGDKLDKKDNYFVLGFRFNNRLYLSNGIIL